MSVRSHVHRKAVVESRVRHRARREVVIQTRYFQKFSDSNRKAEENVVGNLGR